MGNTWAFRKLEDCANATALFGTSSVRKS
jgi:hypothetical protein